MPVYWSKLWTFLEMEIRRVPLSETKEVIRFIEAANESSVLEKRYIPENYV